jgi:TPR repeat protein
MLMAGSRARCLAWRVFFATLVYASVIGGGAAAAEDISAPLKQAQAALSAGDYAVAYPLFKKQAEAGNPLASFTIALFHEHGWGRPVDRAVACIWFEKSAEGKIPAGEHFAGDCLRRGANGPSDPAAAARMYEQAAAHGHLISLCSLAELYIAGEGVPKDVAKGLALCQQAAQKGITTAQVRLARFLLDGVTADPGYPQALQILRVAAETDNPEAQFLLGRMLRDGLGTKANVDLAVGWFERAASKGYLPAYLPTAQLYYGATRDPRTGLLPPEFLAKSYLWTSALVRRSEESADMADAKRLLADVRKEMPSTWAPDLDRKVDEHIAGLATPPAAAR